MCGRSRRNVEHVYLPGRGGLPSLFVWSGVLRVPIVQMRRAASGTLAAVSAEGLVFMTVTNNVTRMEIWPSSYVINVWMNGNSIFSCQFLVQTVTPEDVQKTCRNRL